MSVVIPAYNEEARLAPALEEMVEYLDRRFGRPPMQTAAAKVREREDWERGREKEKAGKEEGKGARRSRTGTPTTPHRLVFGGNKKPADDRVFGYEIIIVNDGSNDRTVDVALDFSRKHGLHNVLRVVTLMKNRGKGGSVTHGFRHVRGEYALFVDADGASKFSDLEKLIEGCEDVVDGSSRGVAIGSRGHLVGSEAVVKVDRPDPLSLSAPSQYAC